MLFDNQKSAYELMLDSAGTPGNYLRIAVDMIDKQFEAGYAAKHPELVGAFVRAAAQDFHTAIMTRTIEEGLNRLVKAHELLGLSLHPSLGDGLSDIAKALRDK